MPTQPHNPDFEQKPKLKHLEKISRLMDSKFTVPGTKFKFGVDPVLGLIPGVGDALTFGVSSYLIYHMYRYGASNKLVVLMMLNVIVDTVIGSIPVLGGIFDFFYKANDRNVRLMKQYYEEGRHRGSGKWIIIVAVILFLAIFAGVIYLIYLLLSWLWMLVQ